MIDDDAGARAWSGEVPKKTGDAEKVSEMSERCRRPERFFLPSLVRGEARPRAQGFQLRWAASRGDPLDRMNACRAFFSPCGSREPALLSWYDRSQGAFLGFSVEASCVPRRRRASKQAAAARGAQAWRALRTTTTLAGWFLWEVRAPQVQGRERGQRGPLSFGSTHPNSFLRSPRRTNPAQGCPQAASRGGRA